MSCGNYTGSARFSYFLHGDLPTKLQIGGGAKFDNIIGWLYTGEDEECRIFHERGNDYVESGRLEEDANSLLAEVGLQDDYIPDIDSDTEVNAKPIYVLRELCGSAGITIEELNRSRAALFNIPVRRRQKRN